MLNLIRSIFGMPPRAPANAVPPTGSFNVLDGRCRGTVFDDDNPGAQPLTVTLVRTADQYLLAQASARSANGDGRYEFAFDLPAGFDTSAIVAEHVGVFVENAFALKGRLELEPANKLELERASAPEPILASEPEPELAIAPQEPLEPAVIQELPTPPARSVVFELGFGQGGTAEPFLGTGWGNLEAAVCCTEGSQAILDVPSPILPDAQYELTIDCFAFLPMPHVQSQRMTVTLNGVPRTVKVDSHDTAPITLAYPMRSLTAAESVRIEVALPDCFRPVDFGLNDDSRQLSFAFRTMTFARILSPGSNGGAAL